MASSIQKCRKQAIQGDPVIPVFIRERNRKERLQLNKGQILAYKESSSWRMAPP